MEREHLSALGDGVVAQVQCIHQVRALILFQIDAKCVYLELKINPFHEVGAK